MAREGLAPSEIVLEVTSTGRQLLSSPVLRVSTWCQTYPAPRPSGAQSGLQPVRRILAQDRTGDSAKDSGSLLQPRLLPCGLGGLSCPLEADGIRQGQICLWWREGLAPRQPLTAQAHSRYPLHLPFIQMGCQCLSLSVLVHKMAGDTC